MLVCLVFVLVGKDSLSWSMYVDNQRSWFMHGGEHMERTEGGISKSSVVGELCYLFFSYTTAELC